VLKNYVEANKNIFRKIGLLKVTTFIVKVKEKEKGEKGIELSWDVFYKKKKFIRYNGRLT